jgi:hypothetical protein
MPLTIPAFVQYQGVTPILRGLWNQKPPEGDRFISAEIDWGTLGGTPPYTAVQFQLSGNSPVALSQIIALSVDNGRCGSDTDFIFPDSGFVLTIAAHNQGIFPVFTNALMFYVSAPGAVSGDVTVFQALNSMPPPIPLIASQSQNHAGIAGIPTANGTTAIVPPNVSGTLNTLSLVIDVTQGASAGTAQISLVDGTGAYLWAYVVTIPASTTLNIPVNLSGLTKRFVNGLSLVISSSTLTGGQITANVYYSTP